MIAITGDATGTTASGWRGAMLAAVAKGPGAAHAGNDLLVGDPTQVTGR